jgi:hypothetical protein
MKTAFTILALALLTFTAAANEIIRGTTLTDGQQLYASDLHGLIDNSTISVQFYNDQQTASGLNAGYYFLLLDPANQIYRRMTAQDVLYGNTNIYLNVVAHSLPSYGYVMFYDPTNNWLSKITASNLVNGLSSAINPALIPYASTNNPGGTNKFVIPAWPYPVFNGFNTNFPVTLTVLDTNGVTYRQSLTNFESSVAADFGTNFSLPFTYNQIFQPWLVYGTNTYGFTNSWGSQTNFAITSLYLTNSYPASTNTAELVDADALPIASTQQGTNTTATLFAIYQYLAAKNTLPPYTTARVQFSGTPVNITISNNANTAFGLVQVASNSFPTNIAPPYAVAVVTNATQVQISMFQTNTLFYVVPQATNGSWFHVYSNYTTAISGTGWLPVLNSGAGPTNQFIYLTNYTSFNADVLQVINPPNTIRTAVYDVYFRTNSPVNANYYISGTAQNISGGNGRFVDINSDTNMITTNKFRIETYNGGGSASVSPLVHVQVLPQ